VKWPNIKSRNLFGHEYEDLEECMKRENMFSKTVSKPYVPQVSERNEDFDDQGNFANSTPRLERRPSMDGSAVFKNMNEDLSDSEMMGERDLLPKKNTILEARWKSGTDSEISGWYNAVVLSRDVNSRRPTFCLRYEDGTIDNSVPIANVRPKLDANVCIFLSFCFSVCVCVFHPNVLHTTTYSNILLT
jgi:hypothetical protein